MELLGITPEPHFVRQPLGWPQVDTGPSSHSGEWGLTVVPAEGPPAMQPSAAAFVLKSITATSCHWAQVYYCYMVPLSPAVSVCVCKPERTIHPLESDILIFVLDNISVKNNNLPVTYPRLILFTWLNYWQEDQFFLLPLHNSSASPRSSVSGGFLSHGGNMESNVFQDNPESGLCLNTVVFFRETQQMKNQKLPNKWSN